MIPLPQETFVIEVHPRDHATSSEGSGSKYLKMLPHPPPPPPTKHPPTTHLSMYVYTYLSLLTVSLWVGGVLYDEFIIFVPVPATQQ